MGVRIDKWLWAARFYKTRSLATERVNGGHVRVDGEAVKPSRKIEIGDTLEIVREQEHFVVTVIALAEKRLSAEKARQLYRESDESIAARQQLHALRKLNAATAPAPKRRPDKRARRKIIRFVRRED